MAPTKGSVGVMMTSKTTRRTLANAGAHDSRPALNRAWENVANMTNAGYPAWTAVRFRLLRGPAITEIDSA